eukprot:scaffold17.g580.t1
MQLPLAPPQVIVPRSSPNDKRQYRALTLPNGLRVFLISDPEVAAGAAGATDPGAAAAAARQKACSDGDDVDSLMGDGDEDEEMEEGSSEEGSEEEGSEEEGSEGEGEHEHVHQHSGQHRHHPAGATKKAAAALACGVGSYTDPWRAQECTTYHFDVKPDALRGALERFAAFFVAPLVKRDAMDREVNAVDNEFSGVLQSDGCRLMQLRCATAKEGHLVRKFGWGNRKSLVDDPAAAEIDMRAELLSYYQQQYSAERMNLAWAEELFGRVPGGRGPRPTHEGAGFPQAGGRLCCLPGVRQEHRLEATFQFPCLAKEYRKKAEDYVSHLCAVQLCRPAARPTDPSAGVAESTSVCSVFSVSITLTEAGLAAAPGCGLACVRLLFEYLALLRREGPQRWVWEEQAAMGAMRFRFQEEEEAADYVANIAGDLHLYPAADVLAQPNLYEEYDPGLIGSLLAAMTPAAVRLDLQTHDYDACCAALEAAMPGATAATEPWFGFPYIEAPLPVELLAAWEQARQTAQPSAELALPPRNDYIPLDFSLCCEDASEAGAAAAAADGSAAGTAVGGEGGADARQSSEGTGAGEDGAFPSPPALVIDEPGLRLFHKLDSTFRVPRTNAYFKIVSLATYDSARAAALTHLVVKLLEDALCETAYAADVAGLHYGIWFEGRAGLDFKIDGFSHKLPLLVEFIFASLARLGPTLTPDAFARVKEALERSYRNTNMKPLKHANYLRLYALRDLMWHPDAVLPELAAATLEDVRAFLPSLLAELHVEALLHGNITRAEARQLVRQVHATLGGSRLAADARPADQTACADTVADRAAIDLLDQMLYEPCFDTLRTREQLGYTVSSGMRLTHGVLGFALLVMSGEHGPAHLDARIDAFLLAFGDLANMSAEEFEKHRAALISAKLQKDAHMVHESDRAWDAIASRRYDFGVRRDEVAHLRAIELSQASCGLLQCPVLGLGRLPPALRVRAFFNRHLHPGAPACRKLSIHVVGKGHLAELDAPPPPVAAPGGAKAENGTTDAAAVLLPSLDAFKAAASLYAPVAGTPPPLVAVE